MWGYRDQSVYRPSNSIFSKDLFYLVFVFWFGRGLLQFQAQFAHGYTPGRDQAESAFLKWTPSSQSSFSSASQGKLTNRQSITCSKVHSRRRKSKAGRRHAKGRETTVAQSERAVSASAQVQGVVKRPWSVDLLCAVEAVIMSRKVCGWNKFFMEGWFDSFVRKFLNEHFLADKITLGFKEVNTWGFDFMYVLLIAVTTWRHHDPLDWFVWHNDYTSEVKT